MWRLWVDGCDRWLKRQPLFATAMVAVVCLLVGNHHMVWAGLLAVILGLFGVYLSGWKMGVAWLLTGVLVLGVFGMRVESSKLAQLELLAQGEAHREGLVLEDARGSERFWYAPVRLSSGAKVWWQGRGDVPVAGSSVSAMGQFSPLEGARNPGEFDREKWLRRQGVVAEFRQGYRKGELEIGQWAEWGAMWRQEFRRRMVVGLDEDSAAAQVIRAVVMGERPSASDGLIEVFRHSGTLHVFSVSGLHVAMVGSLGWLLLSGLGVPRRWAVVCLLPLVFGYAWITGANPPAIRAAWMASLFLGAFVFRRQPSLLNALGLVLWVGLLWDGRQLFQPGVQLSYGVVAVIAVANPVAIRVFSWMAKPELYLPVSLMTRWQLAWLKFRQRVAQSLSVSLAAGLGSAPLTATHFGLVTPISILASVVLVPMVFVLLATALAGVLVSFVAEPVAKVVNQANGGLAVGCVHVADGFASVPGGHFRWGVDHRPMLLIYDLDYGEQAACFYGGRGEGAVMLDCGGSRSFRYRVAPSLKRLGIAPDSAVLSHPDGGHLGGGMVMDEFPIQQVLMPVRRSRSGVYKGWLAEAPSHGVAVHHADELASVDFPDGAVLEILHAPDGSQPNARANERVAVFRMNWRGWKFLFLGDAGLETEYAMLDAGVDISADVLIAGKNRSDVSISDRLLEAVSPRVMVLSNDDFPAEEQRSSERLDYWRSIGVEVFDQAESGGVTLRVDESMLEVDGFVSGQSLQLTPR